MKKAERTEDAEIAEKEILSIYRSILPLLTDNPRNLDLAVQVERSVRALIPFDFFHYVMDSSSLPGESGKIETSMIQWHGIDDNATVSLHANFEADSERAFEIEVIRSKGKVVALTNAQFPDRIHEYHYHEISFEDHPRIVVGFFRFKDAKGNNDFTASEVQKLESLAPDVLLLFRTVLNLATRSDAFRYFDRFSAICSRIVREHQLSDAEVRLLPDLLFGYSTESIAERQFISVATVKSHINRILRKTDTKSRLDFIRKFFTSPDRVEL